MLEAIYTGNELGAGGGGGGSTNPTSGKLPINIFGSFQDSLISGTTDLGNGTSLIVNDGTQQIIGAAGTSFVLIDGAADSVTIDGFNGVKLNGGVFVNNHLGLDILRFLSNGSSHAAIKVIGNRLFIVNGNDSSRNDLIARDITAEGDVITWNKIIFGGSSTDAQIDSNGDGVLLLTNGAGADFKRLLFGGTTNLFPAIKKGSAGLQIRKADDSGDENLTAANITASGIVTTTQDFSVQSRSIISSLVNSNLTLYNAAKTAFNLLQFGGINSSFPALKRSGTELQVRLSDDSGPAPFRTGVLTVEGGGISIPSGPLNIYAGTSASNSIIYGNLSGISVGKGASLPVASALIEMASNTRGFLPPRMTNAQRTAIASPAVGLMVYCTDTTEGLYIYKSTGWTFII